MVSASSGTELGYLACCLASAAAEADAPTAISLLCNPWAIVKNSKSLPAASVDIPPIRRYKKRSNAQV